MPSTMETPQRRRHRPTAGVAGGPAARLPHALLAPCCLPSPELQFSLPGPCPSLPRSTPTCGGPGRACPGRSGALGSLRSSGPPTGPPRGTHKLLCPSPPCPGGRGSAAPGLARTGGVTPQPPPRSPVRELPLPPGGPGLESPPDGSHLRLLAGRVSRSALPPQGPGPGAAASSRPAGLRGGTGGRTGTPGPVPPRAGAAPLPLSAVLMAGCRCRATPAAAPAPPPASSLMCAPGGCVTRCPARTGAARGRGAARPPPGG